jgi:hypothetical protein
VCQASSAPTARPGGPPGRLEIRSKATDIAAGGPARPDSRVKIADPAPVAPETDPLGRVFDERAKTVKFFLIYNLFYAFRRASSSNSITRPEAVNKGGVCGALGAGKKSAPGCQILGPRTRAFSTLLLILETIAHRPLRTPPLTQNALAACRRGRKGGSSLHTSCPPRQESDREKPFHAVGSGGQVNPVPHSVRHPNLPFLVDDECLHFGQ